MDDFNQVIADLKSGNNGKMAKDGFTVSAHTFHDDVKMRRFRLGGGRRCVSFPCDSNDLSPSALLVLKVKAKIDQQISPHASKRSIVRALVHAANAEKRPMRMQLQTADSLPSFECPFNMIKNLQKIHAEKMMQDHVLNVNTKGGVSAESFRSNQFDKPNLSARIPKKSLSSIELNPLTDAPPRVKSAVDMNNNETMIYRELLTYLTGQVSLSRGSIEEFHRASQPDLFLMCISKMRSNEESGSSTTDWRYPPAPPVSMATETFRNSQALNLRGSYLSDTSYAGTDLEEDTPFPCDDSADEREGPNDGRHSRNKIVGFSPKIDDGTSPVDIVANKCPAEEVPKKQDSLLPGTLIHQINSKGVVGQFLNTYSQNSLRPTSPMEQKKVAFDDHPNKEKTCNEPNEEPHSHSHQQSQAENKNNANIDGQPSDETNSYVPEQDDQIQYERNEEDHNTNRCAISTSVGNPSASTQNEPSDIRRGRSAVLPMIGPDIQIDESEFECPDVDWSIYVRHSNLPISLSVVSTNSTLPNMTSEQLDIYKKFISHLGMLHKKGVEVFDETRTDVSQASYPVMVLNNERVIHKPQNKPTNANDRLGVNNNGPSATARNVLYPAHEGHGPPYEYKTLENDKMIRLQIENTGLRIKNRDVTLRLKRAEDILNMGPGDNEDGSLVDKLLKNTQFYMQELDRVNTVMHHDKAIIKDLDHAQQQLIDDYSNRENELEVQMQHLINEMDLLRNKYRTLEDENDDMYEEKRTQDETIVDLRQQIEKMKADTTAHIKEMDEQYHADIGARDRAKNAMVEDLRRASEDYKLVEAERDQLEKENDELSEENAAQNQFLNELQVELAVAETKTQAAYENEDRLRIAETMVQDQIDDLLAWEQEYNLMSSRVNELLESAAEMRADNQNLGMQVKELEDELTELAEVNEDMRERLENGSLTSSRHSVASAGRRGCQPSASVNSERLARDATTIAMLQDEATVANSRLEQASKDLKKQQEKSHTLKEQLFGIQNMHSTFQQHMNFKYKNIVREFKKKVQFYESENAKLTSQVQNIIYTNDTLNSTLSKKNAEINQLQDDVTTVEAEMKQMAVYMRKTEEALTFEQDQHLQLVHKNHELVEKMNTLKSHVSKRDAEGDALPACVKQLNKMVAAMGETMQSFDVNRRQSTNRFRDDSQHVHELKKRIGQLEAELSAEKMMHDVTKTSLRNAEEDMTRLRQSARSVYTRSSINETRRGNRTEQINQKIRDHQMKAQYLLGLHRTSNHSAASLRTSSSLI